MIGVGGEEGRRGGGGGGYYTSGGVSTVPIWTLGEKKSAGLITRRLTVKSWPKLPSRDKQVDAAHF